MVIKKQLKVLKDNWLIVALLVVLVLFMNIGGLFTNSFNIMESSMSKAMYDNGYDGGMYAEDMAMSRGLTSYIPYYGENFAPDVENRVLTKYANLNTEVENGDFMLASVALKNALEAHNTILLDENVNSYGKDRKEYQIGYYSIKVSTSDYDSFITQLKGIGEVHSFSENIDDITGEYTSVDDSLDAEKEKLKRYENLYDEAETIEDKLNLNDRIFEQERTIKYLEDRVENMDNRVDYSSVSFRITEESPKFSDIEFVEFKDIAKNFVNSLNNLINLIIVIIPWIIALIVLRFGWKLYKK